MRIREAAIQARAGRRAAGARFLTLDAMRGVAALAVLSSHFAGTFGGWQPRHSALAVDLFYVLSGFVLATANDARFAQGLSAASFLKRRLRRLAPLFLLGIALGAAVQLIHRDRALGGGRLLAALAANTLLLPSPFVADNGNVFPIDQTFWSLALELWVVNTLYALFWKRLRGPALAVLIGLSGAGLIGLTHRTGIAGGWSYATLPTGFCRALFSFFMGVALARVFAARPHGVRIPGPCILAMEALALWAPGAGAASGPIQALSVLVFFPALVLVAAQSTHISEQVGRRVGDAAYAAYALHYLLLTLCTVFAARAIAPHRGLAQLAFILIVSALSFAAAAWDERLRSQARTRRSASDPAPAAT